MKKLKLIAAILALIFVQTGFAQIKVTGFVTDANNGNPLSGVSVMEKGTSNRTISDYDGKYSIDVMGKKSVIIFSLIGYKISEQKVGSKTSINMKLKSNIQILDDVDEVVVDYGETNRRHSVSGAKKELRSESVKSTEDYYKIQEKRDTKRSNSSVKKNEIAPKITLNTNPQGFVKIQNNKPLKDPVTGSESYTKVSENSFKLVSANPLSTFSVDVDRAAYSNVRRFINNGEKPPVDAVRIEEMVNYFHYDYPEPKSEHPVEIYSEVSVCPWQSKHKLLHIGLQGKKIADENLPPSNFVFLIDVSGSMSSYNKLPLLKDALKLLTSNLRENDRVAIVVYAGAAGMVLPSTFGYHKEKIIEALDKLTSGGSTAGGEGIMLAYKIAKENFVHGGNNRIILATDGDFNVGASSDSDMEKLIEERRNDGIFLTCLGFGMGNYKDSKMETLADKGNGNYAYIDNIDEAKKTLVSEFGGTMYTIAKDVKLQLEFNPAKVKAYRLVGYENRVLNDEDFNNDTKDAGEMGAGHTVTALYEIIPVGVESKFVPDVDELKYQKSKVNQSKELVNIKVRYKQPLGDKSVKFEVPVTGEKSKLDETSDNYRFASSVALFGMLLSDSKYISHGDYSTVVQLATNSKGADKAGYRAEFIELVNKVYKSGLAKK